MRNIFIVVAGGNYDAEKHFDTTIKQKRTVEEVKQFLDAEQVKNLTNIYHNSPFIVWGTIPGPQNERKWDAMSPGDIVLIYQRGNIKYVGEIAAKSRSAQLAKYFWKENIQGSTWELIYFIVNEQEVNVPMTKLNELFGYLPNYLPQGLTKIDSEKATQFFHNYGDITGVLKTIERGEEITIIPQTNNHVPELLEDQIVRAPTEHDEMQWRLIRLGQLARCDVWVPTNDQSKQYEGNVFREHVLREFHQSMDVPPSVKNIDVVWKFGPYSIQSAFEIEHSTSVYSGILRLSDLRAETPNSSFPLIIVASEERRRKVFEELKRPTFSGPCLRLNEVVRFLGYSKVREFDQEKNASKNPFDLAELLKLTEQPV